jgi:tetratricopeptide (TPR) repeat protein
VRKILRSLTVIPEELYVERDADRQLASIVANMGRPGYVLVARQMGKTNLLLHARRKADASGLFVYLDLSNSFPDIRSFLRNIIDVAVETMSTPGDVMRQIRLARSNLDMLPHKEHEWELRTLLGEFQGQFVICLDEIDALTKSEYSDQVFSFVRSVYFSGRANFPEFERLTYLLSGVAEPSDIIKNRDISPFNIGEKILLQDFNIGEFQELVGRANLSMPAAVVTAIYKWTNGHPRMSWDVCSQLEEIALRGISIEPALVDQVVSSLYFAEVNMPPVDQIKRLVEDTPEIRDALISVHYSRGEAIPDATRTKLYLAGICQAPNAKVVEFKNRVIEEALSEKFLLSIARTVAHEAAIVVGEREFNAGAFESAIERFTAALKAAHDTDDEEIEGLAHHWLGRARYALGELESAAADFQAASTLLVDEAVVLNSFYFGHLCLARAQYKEARHELERVVSDATSKALALEASVDLAGAIVSIDFSDKGQAAENLCLRVCSSATEILNAAGYQRMGGDTLALAHHTLATIYLRHGRRSDALREIELGLETAGLNIQLRLLLLQADALPDKKEFFLTKSKTLILADAVIDGASPAKSVSYETCRDLIIRLERAARTSDALELVEYILSSTTSESELVKVFDRIALDIVHGAAPNLAGRVFEQTLLKHGEKFSSEEIRRFIATVCSVAPERAFGFAGQFIDLVESQGGGLRASELMLLNNIVFYSITAKNRDLAERALTLIQAEPSDLGTMAPTHQKAWRTFKEYLEAYSGLVFGPSASSFDRARRLFWGLRDMRSFELGNIKSDFVSSMRRSLEQELRVHTAKFGEVRRGRKIGRNEIVVVRYGEELKQGKFKHFQADVLAGRCTLVDA